MMILGMLPGHRQGRWHGKRRVIIIVQDGHNTGPAPSHFSTERGKLEGRNGLVCVNDCMTSSGDLGKGR